MDTNRLLELAVAELERQKAGIDAEIETIRAELGGTGSPVMEARPVSAGTRRRKRRTPAERRAHSERMRQYWAKKKAQATKASAVAKKPAASAKVRKWTDAEKRALSLKLKEAWKKRKAAAVKSAKTK